MDDSKQDKKPASVVVGKVGPASPVSGVDQEIWSPNTPIVGNLQINHPQVGRLKVATGVFLFSMLMNWGYHFWSGWYFLMWIENDGGVSSDSSMLYWITDSALAYDGGSGFFEIVSIFGRVSFWGELAGLTGLVFIVILMRELMPLVFTGMFVYCWLKRDQGPDLFQKIAFFNGVYFAIVAVFFIYVFTHLALDSIWGESFEMSILDSLGFWLAGVAGMVVHPRAIPMPAWVESSRDSLPTRSVGSVYPNDFAVVESTSNSSLILYYLPNGVFWLSFLSLWNGGDDDIMFWGVVTPIAGFLVSIAVHRWEVVKGFVLNIGFSMVVALVFWFVFSADAAEDLFFDAEFLFLFFIILASAILPIRLLYTNKYVRALGSVYAMPICMFIIMFGVLLAVF